MGIRKTITIVKTILTFKVDKIKLLNYVEEIAGRGAKERLGYELRNLRDINNDGKIDILELVLFILNKLK